MDGVIARRPLRCKERDINRHGRIVADCFVGSMNLNNELVKQSWAVAYRDYYKAHIKAEETAQAAKQGIAGRAPSECP